MDVQNMLTECLGNIKFVYLYSKGVKIKLGVGFSLLPLQRPTLLKLRMNMEYFWHIKAFSDFKYRPEQFHNVWDCVVFSNECSVTTGAEAGKVCALPKSGQTFESKIFII